MSFILTNASIPMKGGAGHDESRVEAKKRISSTPRDKATTSGREEIGRGSEELPWMKVFEIICLSVEPCCLTLYIPVSLGAPGGKGRQQDSSN